MIRTYGSHFIRPFKLISAHQRLSLAKAPQLAMADHDCVLTLVDKLRKAARTIAWKNAGGAHLRKLYEWYLERSLARSVFDRCQRGR
jgi:hypothetical protein